MGSFNSPIVRLLMDDSVLLLSIISFNKYPRDFELPTDNTDHEE